MTAITPKVDKILFCVGPGDAEHAFSCWLDNLPCLSETSHTFTHETLDFCHAAGVNSWLISSNNRNTITRVDNICVENRPKSSYFLGISSTSYFIRDLLYSLSILRSVRSFRPDIIVLDSGTFHWFFGLLFLFSKCDIYPNFHNAHHPNFLGKRAFRKRLLDALDTLFFKYLTRGAFGVSALCGRQYICLIKAERPFHQFSPTFSRERFSCPIPQTASNSDFSQRFHFLYAGRIEREKGIFILLSAFKKILNLFPSTKLSLEICGSGSAAEDLIQEIANLGLSSTVGFLGRLPASTLISAYKRSDIVVVPTTTKFAEGFAMVCAESVLCERPFIASSVVPAAEEFKDACVAVHPDKEDALAHAMEECVRDPKLYVQLKTNTLKYHANLYDRKFGLASAFWHAFTDAKLPDQLSGSLSYSIQKFNK